MEPVVDNEKNALILDLLPKNFTYKILKYICDENMFNFDLVFRVNVKTVSEVNNFLSELNRSLGCSFNIRSGRPDRHQNNTAARSQLRGFRKCCLNVSDSENKENRQPGKNTNCQAKFNFRLENPLSKQTDEKKIKEDFPLWIDLHFFHNHALERAEHVKYLSVSQDTKSAFTKMFEYGYTPRSAHNNMRKLIKSDYPDTWPQKFADRSILPSIFWCYYWHRLWLERHIGGRDGLDSYIKAEEMIKQFDSTCKSEFPLADGEMYAKIDQSQTGQTVVAIVDPFMRRVHKAIPQSGDLVLIDATSNLDRNDTKLFHMICPSLIGGLPLALLITTREDAETVQFGLEMLKSILPSDAFFGRGNVIGPQLFMSDDSDVLRRAIKNTWSYAVLLLCIFHVLQAQWTWLWDSNHGIAKDDRPHLLKLFRNVVYAESEPKLDDCLKILYADPIFQKYPLFKLHLERDTLPKKDAWSLAHRISAKLPTSNNNTNNLVETSFRYTKEEQFNRHKAYNLPDMLTLLLDQSEFYANKCVDAANNVILRWLKNCHSKYVFKTPNIDPESIIQISQCSYLVPSEKNSATSYFVDMERRTCVCPQGQLKGPCKHKYLVSIVKGIPCFDVVSSENPEVRRILMFVGTGKDFPLDWFLPLQAKNVPDPSPLAYLQSSNIAPNINTQLNANAEVQDFETSNQKVATITSDIDVKEKFVNTISHLQQKLFARIDSDLIGYSKAIEAFSKTVQKLPSTSDTALQKVLYGFGKSVTQVGNFIYQNQ